MPPARTPRRQPAPFPGYQATTGTRPEQAARDVLPGYPLAHHIDDFLADLANANKPRNTIRAYRGDLISFAAHHDGEISGLTAAPVRAFLGEIAGQAPATRKRKRAAVASFCKWAVRHELLDASPIDRIDAIEVPRTLPRPAAAADVAAVLDEQPPEPDLAPGKYRLGRKVEENVVRFDLDRPGPVDRLILSQISHPSSLTLDAHRPTPAA
jgi:integrase